MLTTGRLFRKDRLVDLERTVKSLHGQLREMQSELDRAKAEPVPNRVWRDFANVTGGREFMSDVCNRRARPNQRMLSHVDSRL